MMRERGKAERVLAKNGSTLALAFRDASDLLFEDMLPALPHKLETKIMQSDEFSSLFTVAMSHADKSNLMSHI